MKSIILAALLGTLTYEQVNAAQLRGPSGIREHAASVATNAGVKDKTNSAANAAVIRS
jgi:hypothetical protein